MLNELGFIIYQSFSKGRNIGCQKWSITAVIFAIIIDGSYWFVAYRYSATGLRVVCIDSV